MPKASSKTFKTGVMALVVQDAAVTIFWSEVIDSIDNVWQLTLARGRQQNLCRSLALQVLRKARFIAPATSVVDDQSVVYPVGGVVDRGRIVGIDDSNRDSIGNYGVVLMINRDRSVKRPVHGVSAKQACALH